jgi:flagellar P-ring protein precursor FlgI
MRHNGARILLAAILAGLLIALPAHAVRIKDLGRVYGPMDNPLVGYGLVTGLNGSGDDAKFAPAIKMLSNMLTRLGAGSLPVEVRGSKNAALVMVSGVLAPFNGAGDRFNVEVTAVGNAKSLEGGSLVVCPLGAMGEEYAIASGALEVDPEYPTRATVAGGGIVQKQVPAQLTPNGRVTFKLLPQNADFSIATLIVAAIHQDLSIDIANGDDPIARAVDAATIEIKLSAKQLEDPVPFISQIERLPVPGLDYHMEARVVIDQKKGTYYAMNGNVEIAPRVVAQYGSIQVQIEATQGEEATTLENLVDALRNLNASPEDVVGILKALETLGALHAKVIRE